VPHLLSRLRWRAVARSLVEDELRQLAACPFDELVTYTREPRPSTTRLRGGMAYELSISARQLQPLQVEITVRAVPPGRFHARRAVQAGFVTEAGVGVISHVDLLAVRPRSVPPTRRR